MTAARDEIATIGLLGLILLAAVIPLSRALPRHRAERAAVRRSRPAWTGAVRTAHLQLAGLPAARFRRPRPSPRPRADDAMTRPDRPALEVCERLASLISPCHRPAHRVTNRSMAAGRESTTLSMLEFLGRSNVNHKVFLALTALAVFPIMASAQDAPATPANPIASSEKGFYMIVSGNVVAAAEKMPEEHYSFKPTSDVRSFGQLIGHVADAQYMFCAIASGDTPSPKGIEKSKTSKADLVAALKEAVAYCNQTYSNMTDAQGSQMVKFWTCPQS